MEMFFFVYNSSIVNIKIEAQIDYDCCTTRMCANLRNSAKIVYHWLSVGLKM